MLMVHLTTWLEKEVLIIQVHKRYLGTEWNEWQDQWTGNPRTSDKIVSRRTVIENRVDVVQTRS